MRETIRYSIILSLIFAAAAFVSVREASAQNVLGEILKRMDDHNKSLQSVQATVRMDKHNPQLNVTDSYSGSTKYLPKTKNGMYMRLDWTKPTVEQISVIGDKYELYKPSINQLYHGQVKKAKTSAAAGNALGFMNMSKEQLKANYNVKYIGQETIGGTATWRLELVPKAPTSYKTADLWIDGNGMPIQAKITEQNNDTTTVLLENIQKNVTISTAVFKLSYPSSVKKIAA